MYFLKNKDLRIAFVVTQGVAAPYIISDLYEAGLSHPLTKKYNYQLFKLDYNKIFETEKELYDKLGADISKYSPDIFVMYGIQAHILNLFYGSHIYTCSLFYDDIYNTVKNYPNNADYFTLMKYDYNTIFISDMIWQNELFENAGVKSNFLRLGVNTQKFSERSIPEKYDYEISFIGTLSKERVDILSSIKNYKVNIWGRVTDEIGDKPVPSNFVFHSFSDYYNTTPEIYNKSKININISAAQLKTGVSQRIFDIPAVNGFLLSDYRADLDEIFENKVVYFKNADELNKLIDFYMNNEPARLDYIKFSNGKILAQHTYQKRFEKIIDTLEEKYKLSTK